MRASWLAAAVALAGLWAAAGCSDDPPRVEVSWRLVGADGVSTLSCEQAGTKELNVHVHNGERHDQSPHLFTQNELCSAGRASRTLEEGTFWVTVVLIDEQSSAIADLETSGPYELRDGVVVKVPDVILKPR